MTAAMALGLATVLLTASFHFAVMVLVAERASREIDRRVLRFITVVLVASVAHLFEAGIWAAALGSGRAVGLGEFDGDAAVGAMDVFAFSLVNFATLGLGDLQPTGHLKFVAALEALNGFLLITCSASFIHKAVSRE